MEKVEAPEISPELLQQHPLVALALFAFLMLFSLLVVAALTSWAYLIVRVSQGKPVLVVEPWKPRVWGLVDLIFAGAMLFFWQIQFAALGARFLGMNRQELTDENSLPLTLVTLLGVGNLIAMFSSILWIVVRHRVTLAQLGFDMQQWGKHLAMGVIAAVAVLPLVYALMAAVSIGLDNTYNHPLLEAMKRDGSWKAYLLTVISAALIAPVVEEYLFRVLIQGWLQSWHSSSLEAIVLGASEEKRGLAALPVAAAPLDAATIDSQLPRASVTASIHEELATQQPPLPPLWPALVTGVLFGLAHLGYGLSFIPLIVLGIILGLLYRATHSIWPSLMVHFILNSSSMIALGIGVLIESVAKK